MSSRLVSTAEQRAKESENYPSLFGSVNLTSIRENVGEILKLIGRDGIFREYTLHDANHIDAMLALVDKLIPADTAAKMSTADWLLLVLACYFHDLGMVVTRGEFEGRHNATEFLAFKAELLTGDKGKDYEEALGEATPEEREEFIYQEFVRKYHAKRISLWIQGRDANVYGNASAAVETVNNLLGGLEQVVRDDLAKICLSHHEDDLFDLDKYQVNRVYGDDPAGEANLHYVALILRTADVLQIQRKRVPPVLYKLIDPSNPRSQEEWAKQAGVRAVKPKILADGTESDTIEVHAAFDKESAYFGLLAYLQQFAEKELQLCHGWAKRAQEKGAIFRYPWKQIDTSQVEPRGFEGRSYRFALDQEKILKLLTGHTLYNNARVAIREVLQNALDAVRFRQHLFPAEPPGKIEITWDSPARRLTIRDTGIGMTQDTIERFLLNVGSSFYQSDIVLQKHSDFSPISRFGIGVLSTFMIADEVQILTVHPDDESARLLKLPSVVKSYLIKKLSKTDPAVLAIGSHGTEVILQIRRSADIRNVEAMVRHWLVIPGCEVTCKTDEGAPVSIGFVNATAALEHYFAQRKPKFAWKIATEVRAAGGAGIDLAYVVQKWAGADVWDFASAPGERTPSWLSWAPGVCVEGIRVRSIPAGYEHWSGAPWVFANLTGRDAPRTNVARSDIEQTPEFDRTLLAIYSLLANHAQSEFARLLQKHGIVEAAREADFIVRNGLEMGQLSNNRAFDEAIAALRVIALEDRSACRPVTKRELESFPEFWTVDGRLVENIEGVSGVLGIDMSAERVVDALGKQISPTVPTPRLLGKSTRPLRGMEVSSIRIYPEERDHRIDIRWARAKPGRWVIVSPEVRREMDHHSGRADLGLPRYDVIQISQERHVSSECPGYDLIVWRQQCLILAGSCVPELLTVLGLTAEFGRCLAMLLSHGVIPLSERPWLKERLVAATGVQGEELLSRLALPFERRIGDHRASARGVRQFDYEE